jgi:hypothetical protein
MSASKRKPKEISVRRVGKERMLGVEFSFALHDGPCGFSNHFGEEKRRRRSFKHLNRKFDLVLVSIFQTDR